MIKRGVAAHSVRVKGHDLLSRSNELSRLVLALDGAALPRPHTGALRERFEEKLRPIAFFLGEHLKKSGSWPRGVSHLEIVLSNRDEILKGGEWFRTTSIDASAFRWRDNDEVSLKLFERLAAEALRRSFPEAGTPDLDEFYRNDRVFRWTPASGPDWAVMLEIRPGRFSATASVDGSTFAVHDSSSSTFHWLYLFGTVRVSGKRLTILAKTNQPVVVEGGAGVTGRRGREMRFIVERAPVPVVVQRFFDGWKPLV